MRSADSPELPDVHLPARHMAFLVGQRSLYSLSGMSTEGIVHGRKRSMRSRTKVAITTASAGVLVALMPSIASASVGQGWYGGDLGISGSCVQAQTSTVNVFWYSCVDYASSSGQVIARAHPTSAASAYANTCEYSYNTTNGAVYLTTCGTLVHSDARLNFTTPQSFAQSSLYCPVDSPTRYHAFGGDIKGQQGSSYSTYTSSLSRLCN